MKAADLEEQAKARREWEDQHPEAALRLDHLSADIDRLARAVNRAALEPERAHVRERFTSPDQVRELSLSLEL